MQHKMASCALKTVGLQFLSFSVPFLLSSYSGGGALWDVLFTLIRVPVFIG